MTGDLPVDVSRETRERLEAFAGHLQKWNRAINLIAPGTVPDIWERHIVDSAQLWPLRDSGAGSWYDLGAGGGLPGIVLAMIAKEQDPNLGFTLIESDTRKAAFLSRMICENGLNAKVQISRIEEADLPPADIVSARALAPLERLLELATPLVKKDGLLIFPKGRRVSSELTDATQRWRLIYEAVSSSTDPEANILKIREFHRLP